MVDPSLCDAKSLTHLIPSFFSKLIGYEALIKVNKVTILSVPLDNKCFQSQPMTLALMEEAAALIFQRLEPRNTSHVSL